MSLTMTYKLSLGRGAKGRVELAERESDVGDGDAGDEAIAETPPLHPPPAPVGRVPRISRLMALAIRFEGLLSRGEVKDYAELARLGHVSRARVTQIMNLLMLAPDIQEAILFLPPVESGHDPIREWQVRPIVAEMGWERQRRKWQSLTEAR